MRDSLSYFQYEEKWPSRLKWDDQWQIGIANFPPSSKLYDFLSNLHSTGKIKKRKKTLYSSAFAELPLLEYFMPLFIDFLLRLDWMNAVTGNGFHSGLLGLFSPTSSCLLSSSKCLKVGYVGGGGLEVDSWSWGPGFKYCCLQMYFRMACHSKTSLESLRLHKEKKKLFSFLISIKIKATKKFALW